MEKYQFHDIQRAQEATKVRDLRSNHSVKYPNHKNLSNQEQASCVFDQEKDIWPRGIDEIDQSL